MSNETADVSKRLVETLSTINGIGNLTGKKLLKRFGSLRNVAEAKTHEVEATISKSAAKKLKTFLSCPLTLESK